MKITYKDVGQGDSIILEWIDNSKPKIGIIDCNLKGTKNPVLDYVRKAGYEIIEFIVLSHPHRDHYSGLLELFDYAESNRIVIQQFAHTLAWVGDDFWKFMEIGTEDRKRLNKIIQALGELRRSGIIKKMKKLSDDCMPLQLSSKIKLTCLSPSDEDIQRYKREVNFNAGKNPKAASEAANHLSTVFLLEIDNRYGLFTSDAEISALQGVIERNIDLFKEKPVQLCQLPHHGSDKNHCEEFWKKVEVIATDRHAIASAGKHRTYNHPSFSVLESFYRRGYSIHCTNILNGMKEFTALLKTITKRSNALEGGSTIAEEYRKSMDRVFYYKDGTFLTKAS